MQPMLDAGPQAPQSRAAIRRRESVREEGREHRRLAKLLAYYIDQSNTFWTSIENRPLSLLSGLIQKQRGVRAGMPDIAVFHRRGDRTKIVFIELKSKRGTVSDAQKQVRVELLRVGCKYWLARSARGALAALVRSGVRFRHPWQPPQLAQWEGPFPDPTKKMPWAPSVLAQWKQEKREQRQRYLARMTARQNEGAAASAGTTASANPSP
jgi:hypothetical protein